MKVVFVCSPFQGKLENIEKANECCRYVLEKGYILLAPHIYFSQFMDDSNPEDRRKALEMNKRLMEFCDELWVFGDEVTEGMEEEEIEYFKRVKGEEKVKVLNCGTQIIFTLSHPTTSLQTTKLSQEGACTRTH